MGYVLGIDLGTSSVKLVCGQGGALTYESADYEEEGAEQMLRALLRALARLSARIPLHEIDSVGFSGQTGTYVLVDQKGRVVDYLPWCEGRDEQLDAVLARLDQTWFIRATGMAHPHLGSYPLPSILLLRARHGGSLEGLTLLQPKDYLILRLCGRALSDPGSWRGLVNPASLRYDPAMLALAGLREDQLPEMALRASISDSGATLTGLLPGTPVAVGMNDFYAALTGLGVRRPGDCFDITGTSEHFGVLLDERVDSALICSPFQRTYVHYGVTASSGVSLSWARQMFGDGDPALPESAPVFLPYLRGERAPVFDAAARGMFVGLSDKMDAQAMKYAVYEGVVFSIYSIYEALGSPRIGAIRGTGGATRSPLLNRLKASMFGVPYLADRAAHGSAKGALIAAGAAGESESNPFPPDEALGAWLRNRYKVYGRMYGAWRATTEGLESDNVFGGCPNKG